MAKKRSSSAPPPAGAPRTPADPSLHTAPRPASDTAPALSASGAATERASSSAGKTINPRAVSPTDQETSEPAALRPAQLFLLEWRENPRAALDPRRFFDGFGMLYRFFARHWQEMHAEALGEGRPQFRARPLLVLAWASVCLALMEYYGGSNHFRELVRWLAPQQGFFAEWARGVLRGPYLDLWAFGYWGTWRFFGYFVLPAALVLCLRGEKFSEYGLSWRYAKEHKALYFWLFLAVAPAVFLASYGASFQKTYPFYKLASRSYFDFFIFEAFYALQFFSLEFFFRGFLLHALKRDVGVHAIFYMLVPYCMIHFGKPFAETIGAIGAGLILGTLSMRTRSIWGGFAIHVAVAISMDTLSLWQKGQFFH